MRAQYQVMAFLYRKLNINLEFLILQRSDAKYWQAVAGGGEVGETIEQSVIREIQEETGCCEIRYLKKIKTEASIPVHFFKNTNWPKDLDIIKGHYFMAETNNKIQLSNEHIDFKWLSYDDAVELLHWDDDRQSTLKAYIEEVVKRLRSVSKIKSQNLMNYLDELVELYYEPVTNNNLGEILNKENHKRLNDIIHSLLDEKQKVA